MLFKIGRQGFTLIELAVGFTLMAFVLLCTMSVLTNSGLTSESVRSTALAYTHAQFVLEQVSRTVFSDIAANIDAGIWDWNTAAITSKGITALNSESIDTAHSGTDPLTVTVTVSWKDRRDMLRNESLQTMFTQVD
jgi:type II secretory pathway pseudopilin PulG